MAYIYEEIPCFQLINLRFFINILFSFTKILSIGGVVSGGIMAIMILLMVKKAKSHCDRKAEYEVPASWWIIGFLIAIFVAGVIRELLL